MQRFHPFLKTIGIVPLVLIVGFLTLLAVSYVQGWTEPAGAPPLDNVAAPVNVGSGLQYKIGALGIGGIIKGYSDVIGERLCIGDDCRDEWPAGEGICKYWETPYNTGTALDLMYGGKNICADNAGCTVRLGVVYGDTRPGASVGPIVLRQTSSGYNHLYFGGEDKNGNTNAGLIHEAYYSGNLLGHLYDDCNGNSWCGGITETDVNKFTFYGYSASSCSWWLAICD
jgi:hypothetical protein